jgi:hypothetical protein
MAVVIWVVAFGLRLGVAISTGQGPVWASLTRKRSAEWLTGWLTLKLEGCEKAKVVLAARPGPLDFSVSTETDQ